MIPSQPNRLAAWPPLPVSGECVWKPSVREVLHSWQCFSCENGTAGNRSSLNGHRSGPTSASSMRCSIGNASNGLRSVAALLPHSKDEAKAPFRGLEAAGAKAKMSKACDRSQEDCPLKSLLGFKGPPGNKPCCPGACKSSSPAASWRRTGRTGLQRFSTTFKLASCIDGVSSPHLPS